MKSHHFKGYGMEHKKVLIKTLGEVAIELLKIEDKISKMIIPEWRASPMDLHGETIFSELSEKCVNAMISHIDEESIDGDIVFDAIREHDLNTALKIIFENLEESR